MADLNDSSKELSAETKAVLYRLLLDSWRRTADDERTEDWRICARHKAAVINRQLNGIQIIAEDVAVELGDNFKLKYLRHSMFVVADIIATGGANVFGGRTTV